MFRLLADEMLAMDEAGLEAALSNGTITEVDCDVREVRERRPGAAHETARGLADAGVIAKRTMKAFDEMCLTPIEEMTPERIRELRMRENASQAVFARYLNVTTGLVSQWERGEKRPRGPSLKLLTLVAKNGLGACLNPGVERRSADRPAAMRTRALRWATPRYPHLSPIREAIS